jgi:hypothetical protein
LGRTVAVKLLRPERCVDPAWVTRFEREAPSLSILGETPRPEKLVTRAEKERQPC